MSSNDSYPDGSDLTSSLLVGLCAAVSVISTSLVLIYVISFDGKSKRQQKVEGSNSFRTPNSSKRGTSWKLLLSLTALDFVQSIGLLFSLWDGQDKSNAQCTAQAWFIVFGDVGSALITASMGLHMMRTIVRERRDEGTIYERMYFIVSLTLPLIGCVMAQASNGWGKNSTTWCWIRDVNEKYSLEETDANFETRIFVRNFLYYAILVTVFIVNLYYHFKINSHVRKMTEAVRHLLPPSQAHLLPPSSSSTPDVEVQQVSPTVSHADKTLSRVQTRLLLFQLVFVISWLPAVLAVIAFRIWPPHGLPALLIVNQVVRPLQGFFNACAYTLPSSFLKSGFSTSLLRFTSCGCCNSSSKRSSSLGSNSNPESNEFNEYNRF